MTKNKNIVYKTVSVIALLAVMVTIFCLSHEDATESKETSIALTAWLSAILGDIPDGVVRSVAHGCEYAALGFLMYNVFYSFGKFTSPLITGALSFFYAVTDEMHQLFVPGRAFQFVDLLVDLAGIAVGISVILILIKAIKNSKKERL